MEVLSGREGEEGEETDGYLMWQAYGKSLFRKRNSTQVGEYFIQGEKKNIKIYIYVYIRHVVSSNINRYSARHEVINFIEFEKETKARRAERFDSGFRIELPG